MRRPCAPHVPQCQCPSSVRADDRESKHHGIRSESECGGPHTQASPGAQIRGHASSTRCTLKLKGARGARRGTRVHLPGRHSHAKPARPLWHQPSQGSLILVFLEHSAATRCVLAGAAGGQRRCGQRGRARTGNHPRRRGLGRSGTQPARVLPWCQSLREQATRRRRHCTQRGRWGWRWRWHVWARRLPAYARQTIFAC